ncbi:MAG: glutaredoxin family protein [Candidatus Bathyarchaeota archaeon]|nr:glutaredoxin family protein [Candidatus Bathyarchaeota archaeon]MDH5732251.1 glutaredoxin family protein [Candidatus Bathyarchaeota archaeon]
MRTIKVPGKNNKHRVLVYALSTCAWCKRTKKVLIDNDVEYEYVDVDLCSEEERKTISNDILSRGGRLSYPTILIDDRIMITGFHEDKIKEVLAI